MNFRIIITMFILTHSLYSGCLTEEEKSNIKINPNYLISSYIKCDKQYTKLDKFVCNNSNYKLMFQYFSEVDINFWMRNLNMNYDYDKVKKNSMKYFNTDIVNRKNLCFDLKKYTTDYLGGGSPYKIINLNDNEYYLQNNKHGISLTNRDGYKIYLGKACDTLDSKGRKGRWSKISNKYLIKLGKEEFYIHLTEIDIHNYKCLE